MNIFCDVSETALITLKSRVVKSEKENPVINDEIGSEYLEKIRLLLPDELVVSLGCGFDTRSW